MDSAGYLKNPISLYQTPFVVKNLAKSLYFFLHSQINHCPKDSLKKYPLILPPNDILERIGDIQLVTNLEYRFPIISIFEGALFADIGNVWLTHESSEFPDGQFNLKTLPQSIATGIGFGLRANISIITLRCDLGIPLYDPGVEQSKRWCPPHWKLNQVTANFGIDYPF